jgi:hypothetical protein
MEAFNGDHFIDEQVTNLITKFGIKTIFETGTFMGLTTERLASHRLPVHTCEINREYFECDKIRNLDYIPNIYRHLGSSASVLNKVLPTVAHPCLFYLDAHGHGNGTGIVEELFTIGSFSLKDSVICIHDFHVPGKPFGCDTFDGFRLDYPTLKPYIDNIYDKFYSYHYNEKTAGENRGIIYIYPSKVRIK